MALAGLLPMRRGNLRPIALPTSNLTLQLDSSDGSKVWHTLNFSINPCWLNPAVDGDECQVWQSTIPGPTSETPAIIEAGSDSGPIYKTVSPALKLPDLLFDGTNDRMNVSNRTGTINRAISTMISASAATMLVAFQLHSATNNNTPDNNNPLIINATKKIGIAVRRATTAPDTFKIQFYSDDGSGIDFCELDVLLNTSYVACLRHDASTLYGSLNGGTEVTVSSGPTVITDAVKLCGDGARFTGASIGEILVYNAALTGADLAAANAYMVNKWV